MHKYCFEIGDPSISNPIVIDRLLAPPRAGEARLDTQFAEIDCAVTCTCRQARGSARVDPAPMQQAKLPNLRCASSELLWAKVGVVQKPPKKKVDGSEPQKKSVGTHQVFLVIFLISSLSLRINFCKFL